MMFDNMLNQERFSTCITEQRKYQPNGEFRRVKKRPEDPMSHRIIEKRRRDRMNNCLADLSRLIPAEYLKKGRGRIEKTEIIEMAIKHMKYLQSITSNVTNSNESYTDNVKYRLNNGTVVENTFVNDAKLSMMNDISHLNNYRVGYQECLAETMRFLVEFQGFFPTDTLYVKLINHLQRYYQKLTEAATGDIQMRNISQSTITMNDLGSDRQCNNYSTNGIRDSDVNVTTTVLSDHNTADTYQDDNVNSNLREMLVRPQLNETYTSSVRGDTTSDSSPEPCALQNDCSNDTTSPNGSLYSYKFKKNIRERFEKFDKSHMPSMAVYSRKRSDSINSSSSLSSSLSSSPPPKHLYQNGDANLKPVPIFALHSKGMYYVPLTVDSHILTPFATDLTYDCDNVQTYSSSFLHPVTISVNFNRRPSSIQSSKSL